MVKVPVLSEQITEVQPSVCTEGRLRTMEFFLAIRLVPKAKQVVITAGKPSGMAATASATAICRSITVKYQMDDEMNFETGTEYKI